mgnify:CR=1 FL=1
MQFETKYQHFKDSARKCRKIQKHPTHTQHSAPSTTRSSFELIPFWNIREFTVVLGRQHQSSGLTNLFAKVTNKCLDWGSLTDEDVFSASWVQLNGIKYQPGSLLVTSLVQEDIRLFT